MLKSEIETCKPRMKVVLFQVCSGFGAGFEYPVTAAEIFIVVYSREDYSAEYPKTSCFQNSALLRHILGRPKSTSSKLDSPFPIFDFDDS